jgi:hypothetical protein
MIYFLGDQIDYLNDCLSKIKTPHHIHRQIKNFSEESVSLKSSELKVFLFYIAIPLLYNILPPKHFYLLLVYVAAIRILYEPTIALSDIDYAEHLIEKYVEEIGSAFGDHAYNYTVHAHLHLAEQVRDHGPLHGHSQFVFEVI